MEVWALEASALPCAAGDADREVRRRERPYQGLREHRQGEHAIDAGMPESFNRAGQFGDPVRSASTSNWSGTMKVRLRRHPLGARQGPANRVPFQAQGFRLQPRRTFRCTHPTIGISLDRRRRSFNWSFGEIKEAETIATGPSSRARRPVLREDLRPDQGLRVPVRQVPSA